MDKNFYSQVRKNWEYLHPVTRGLTFLDYQIGKAVREFESEMKVIFKKQNFKFFHRLPAVRVKRE